eukprot:CAMPEP_0173156118 /NCGR_PEP_ID=MMETSP1105-20130129/14564_1 /TAXON_ID=2985 /ORGANISM="Ochromonas sp., Strain BG-1" /LENGTH=57 /DNA_ID=CAMNT_0014072781 /DNA_START=358 /DNA_END=528 /DNA_ORIENTATION=+
MKRFRQTDLEVSTTRPTKRCHRWSEESASEDHLSHVHDVLALEVLQTSRCHGLLLIW